MRACTGAVAEPASGTAFGAFGNAGAKTRAQARAAGEHATRRTGCQSAGKQSTRGESTRGEATRSES